ISCVMVCVALIRGTTKTVAANTTASIIPFIISSLLLVLLSQGAASKYRDKKEETL
ncbi:unnamed protein product, partial [marine sediment metagenome]